MTADSSYLEAQALLAKIALGDRQAFSSLYDLMSPHLFGVLLRILKEETLAEEALQDTFVKIWQRAGDYRADKGQVSTWLFAIGRHRALDLLRRQQASAVVNVGEVAEPADEALGPFELAVNLNATASLRECLEALAPQPRSCVVLAYCEGYTHEELSDRLGSPLGTIKSWIRRSLKSLKECLDA